MPVLRPGARLDIYGPPSEDMGLEEAFRLFMCPPFFPVEIEALEGEIVFHDLQDETLVVGDAKVTSRAVPHVGITAGYRVEFAGTTVAYISDHQAPADGSMDVPDSVLELADGADLLIHDAQYTPEEFAAKAHWGHCTIDYAVNVAAQAGAKSIALFHHDPSHDDATLDTLAAKAVAQGEAVGVEVIAAYEGLTIAFDSTRSSRRRRERTDRRPPRRSNDHTPVPATRSPFVRMAIGTRRQHEQEAHAET